MSAAVQIDREPDEDLDTDESLPIGNAWALHLLDDERATRLACERVNRAYKLALEAKGYAKAPSVLPFFQRQLDEIERTIAKRAATRDARANDTGIETPARPAGGRINMSDASSQVLAGLRERGPLALADVAVLLGFDKLAARDVLMALRDDGAITVIGKKRGARWALPGQTLAQAKPVVAAPKSPKAPPPPDSEPPPPSGGEPASAPVPEPIAARVRRSVKKAPPPRVSRSSSLSAFELIQLAVKNGAKSHKRMEGAPFVDVPELAPSKRGVTFRWRGFVVDFSDRAAADEVLRAARKESR